MVQHADDVVAFEMAPQRPDNARIVMNNQAVLPGGQTRGAIRLQQFGCARFGAKEWHRKAERCAGAHPALGPDLATVELDQVLADAQP